MLNNIVLSKEENKVNLYFNESDLAKLDLNQIAHKIVGILAMRT
jgi:hypothetical protein